MRSNVAFVALLVFVLFMPQGSAIEQTYDVSISGILEPQKVIKFTVTAPVANLSFSITIFDTVDGVIIFGRDSLVLNATGVTTMDYIPAQDGSFKVKVVFVTGIVVEKGFLIQHVIDEEDIVPIWLEIVKLRQAMAALREEIAGIANMAIAIAVVGTLTSLVFLIYIRKVTKSVATTELDRIIAEEAQQIAAQIKNKGGGKSA